MIILNFLVTFLSDLTISFQFLPFHMGDDTLITEEKESFSSNIFLWFPYTYYIVSLHVKLQPLGRNLLRRFVPFVNINLIKVT